MAERIETFDVVIPAGTAIATPQTTALTFNPAIVQRIEITVPPGPSGLVGFRVMHSSEVVIPHDSARWIIADNEQIKWEVEGYPIGSAWAVRAYNTDVFDHTLYFRFLVSETRRANPARATFVDIAPGGTTEDGNQPSS